MSKLLALATRLVAPSLLSVLLPLPLLGGCVSYESDPSKIPDPVEPGEMTMGAVGGEDAASAGPEVTESLMRPTLHSGRASEPGADEPQASRTPSLVTRVGGDLDAEIQVLDGVFRYGPSRIESPLPAGYPEPTPPGAIDIKRYPAVRRAEFVSSGSPGSGMNMGFFPLFNHIKRNDIAMTSPVEMDYRDMFDDETGARDDASTRSWTMSFLYRTAELAPTGRDGSVVVTDRPGIEVLSIGMNGPYGTGVVEKGLGLLHEWLEANPGWEVVGEPRAFHYNGPYIPNRIKWSEVQLPVARAD